MSSSLAGVLLGLAVGLRHAFEPDHLTAVATLATETRDAKRGALLGALWGLGHTMSLVIVGVVLIAIGTAMPVRLGAWFELGVCAMLVLLGVRAIVRSRTLGPVGHVHAHAHGGRVHEHGGADAHLHIGRGVFAMRPLAVGLIHGLAGSGALTALVFAELPSASARLGYIALFGVGSIAGMAAASAIVGVSLRAMRRAQRGITVAAGVASISLGIGWSLPLWSIA
ncbi:MAG: hypothetical protein ACKV2T_35210 [Kofleriaceae bacterium]